MRPVILDRDGVINEDSDAYIKSAEEWIPLPGSIEAIAALSRAGFQIFVVTNQSGLARGLFTDIDLANMHEKMCALVEDQGGRIDGILFCPHLPTDACSCRKPETGLIDALCAEFGLSVDGAVLVGDSLKDLQLARRAGCIPVLVLSGKGRDTFKSLPGTEFADILVFDDLAAVATHIIETRL